MLAAKASSPAGLMLPSIRVSNICARAGSASRPATRATTSGSFIFQLRVKFGSLHRAHNRCPEDQSTPGAASPGGTLFDLTTVFVVSGAFFIAGAVKGVIGLGLP